jgi:Large polyvalent protein associated domain 38
MLSVKKRSTVIKCGKASNVDINRVTDIALDLMSTNDKLTEQQAIIDSADYIIKELKDYESQAQKDVLSQYESTQSGEEKKASKIKAPKTMANPEPIKEEPKSVTFLQNHDDVMERINTGEITSNEFKNEFNKLVDNKDAVLAELNKLTVAELKNKWPQLYRNNENKAFYVENAYKDMQSEFVITGGTLSWSMGKDSRLNAIKDRVDKVTDEIIKKYSDEIKAEREKRQAFKEEALKGMENPKTLDDYTRILRDKMDNGATFKDAFMTLTTDQREIYDSLIGERTRDDRKARADQQKTQVSATVTTTSGDIVETKHTKTGEDLFVVKAADRVERETYNEWNITAKRLGGYYSAYKGQGAVPGFTFKSKENAEAFLKYLGGDVSEAKEAVKARRDAYADDKSQSAVERLHEMADRLEERADEELNRERKANTAKRSREAAGAIASAQRSKALAKTMRNIAEAIHSSKTKFLDRVRQKVQVEYLQQLVKTNNYNQIREKYKDNYGEYLKHEHDPATKEIADQVQMPQYSLYRSDLAGLGRQLLETEGTKKYGQAIMKVADDISESYTKFAKDNLHKVMTFTFKDGTRAVFKLKKVAERAIEQSNFNGKASVVQIAKGEYAIVLSPSEAMKSGIWDGDKDKLITLAPSFGAELVEKLGKVNRKKEKVKIPWQFENAYENRKRLAGMGIETPSELRAALREFISLKENVEQPDKIKEMERSLIGRANDGLDFFPTPAHIADSMVDTAGIEEGMSVLEPSAGWGHIAERIREAGVEPDVVELSNNRKELLEAKGFNVVGRDFMEINPREFFTWGDTFKAPDGKEGIMKMSPQGGMGSDRVALKDSNGDLIGYYNRSDLEGVTKNGLDSGYDRILMNPPFSDRRDMEHVQHAYNLLKPGGRLVAIMGEGVFFGQDKKAKSFRDWLEELGGTDEKLEEGTFKDPSLPVTTGVNARMIVIDKPVNAVYEPIQKKQEAKTEEVKSKGQANSIKLKELDNTVNNVKSSIADLTNKNLPERSTLLEQFNKLLDKDAKQVSRQIYDIHYTEDYESLEKIAEKEADKLLKYDFYRHLNINSDDYNKAIEPFYNIAGQYQDQIEKKAEAAYRAIKNNSVNPVKYSKGESTESLNSISNVISLLPKNVKALMDAGKLQVVQSVKDLPKHLQERGTALYHSAWHGSPHDHNKFDSSNIGSGEGAQAFGYGIYFTDKKGIAEWYKEKLSGIKQDFKPIDKGNVAERWNKAKELFPDNKAKQQAWHVLTQNKDWSDLLKVKEWAKENAYSKDARDVTDEVANEMFDQGKLYEVELAPSADEYLDWDKPLSEQSEKVKNALKLSKINFPDKSWNTGQKIYSQSAPKGQYKSNTEQDKAASDYLYSIGIRGIRYKAEGGKSDAFNYVIFDDQDISITAKYSKDLAGVEGLYDTNNDKLYLVADMLDKDNISSVLQHELLHRAEATDSKLKAAINRFKSDLEKRFKAASRGIGSTIEKNAYQRVIDSETSQEDQLEEFRAYMVSEYAKKPQSFVGELKKIFTDFLAAIRASLIRSGLDFKTIRTLTPADLFALSKYGTKIGDENTPVNENKSNVKFSRSSRAQTPQQQRQNFSNWLETEGVKKRDEAIYQIQDRFVDLKRQIEKVTRTGGKVEEYENAYQGEEVYHQRAASRIDNFYEKDLNPLLKKLHSSKISVEDFQKFLHARHAPSRNKVMAERNPSQQVIDTKLEEAKKELERLRKSVTATPKDLRAAMLEVEKWSKAQPFEGTEDERLSLSGLSDADARTIINSYTDDQLDILHELGARIDKINNKTLDLMRYYGMETQDTIESLKNQWEHYVPLHRDEAHPEDNNFGHPIGKGFSVSGSGLRTATGSNAEVTNILAHISQAREQMIKRGEKNFVTMRLANFIRNHPDPSFAELGKIPTYEDLSSDGLKVTRPVPLRSLKNDKNIVLMRVKGKDVIINFNDESPENIRLALSLKNMDGVDLDKIETIVSKGTRWLASVNTQFNPIFGVVNLIRDVQGSLINLSSTEIKGKQGDVLWEINNSIKTIAASERDWQGIGSAQDKALYERFNLAGGTTGFAQMFDNIKDRSKSIEAEYNRNGYGSAKKSLLYIKNAISDFNTIMENATRFSVFKVAVKKGLSDDKAASIAKNISVNFNRKGSYSTKLGAYYAFFNASVQGTARMAETLKGANGKKIISAGVALGALTALLGIMGKGDDEWERIPEFVRERSLIIPAGKGWITIPMPLGFHIFPNIGRKLIESVYGSPKVSLQRRFGDLLSSTYSAFNPLGSSNGDILQMLLPTTLDPLGSLSANKDWTGKSIYLEDFNRLDPTPGFTRVKDSASIPSRIAAEAINKGTGGTDAKKGFWSPTPDQIDYVFGQLFGGVGRETLKGLQVAESLSKDEDIPAFKVPLVGRFYSETTGNAAEASAYYENVLKLNEHKNEIESLKERGGSEKVSEYMKKNPETSRIGMLKEVEKIIKSLKKRRKTLEKNGGKLADINKANDLIAYQMKRLNDAVLKSQSK